MKISTAQFNDSFAPIADGVANAVKNYSLWLNRKYGSSCVITPKHPNYSDHEEFDVLRYYSIPIFRRKPYRVGLPYADLKFAQKLRTYNFDIIHAHSPFSSGKVALRFARQRNIPIVATFHSKFYDDFKAIIKNEMVVKILVDDVMEFYNNVDHVWTVNDATVDTLREYGYKGRVDVVQNGTDFLVDPITIVKKYEKRGADENVNLSNQYRFLFVGQQILQKNLKFLVKSLRALKDMGMDFKMIMVGEGNAKEQIEKMVSDLGMTANFEFKGRIDNREELKSIYESSDLFLFPSIYDNAPLVVREAAAAGCPSVVIRGTNAADGIEDRYNGFVSDNDERVFALTVKNALQDMDRLAGVAKNASRTIARSWESIIDEVAERYSEIILHK